MTIRKATISIPQPCHEDWDEMTVVEKGRFCGSCQKHVYDFTKSSDREILQRYNTETDICGRFLDTQLDRELILPSEKSVKWTAIAASIIACFGGGNQKVQAQIKTKAVVAENSIIHKQATNKNKIVTGTVSDEFGNLAGANIKTKYGNATVSTDAEGHFSLTAKRDDTLIVSYLGYVDKEIAIAPGTNHYDIVLTDTRIVLDGYCTFGRKRSAIAGATFIQTERTITSQHKHTFVGRIICNIANVFRREENKHK